MTEKIVKTAYIEDLYRYNLRWQPPASVYRTKIRNSNEINHFLTSMKRILSFEYLPTYHDRGKIHK